MKNLFKVQLSLFITLLVLWNIFTPYLEGADEPGHFCHADYIAHRNKIPNLNVKDGCFLVYQPLYYLGLVPIIKIFKTPEINLIRLPTNPNWNSTIENEYSQFIHTKSELFFIWNKLQILVHALRLFSSFYAVLIFVLSYKILKSIFGDTKKVHVALLLFFNPMFLHISTTLTNVALINLLGTVIISIELLYFARPKPAKISFLQGIIFGLGILTKISILQLAFAFAVIFFRKYFHLKETFHSKFIEAIAFLSGIGIIAGWYMIRSYKYYGEILEINIARSYAGEFHWTLLSNLGLINFWHSFTDTFFRTFWSGFGALSINYPPVINILLAVTCLFIIIGAVRAYGNASQGIKFCYYFTLSAFAGLIIVNTKTSSMHAKDVFIAYLPISVLFVHGLLKAKELLEKNNFSTGWKLLVFTLSTYYFAREEIVYLIKSLLNTKDNITSGISVLILAKALIVYILVKLTKYMLTKFSLDVTLIKRLTIILFLINIFVITVSTHLFYFRFL